MIQVSIKVQQLKMTAHVTPCFQYTPHMGMVKSNLHVTGQVLALNCQKHSLFTNNCIRQYLRNILRVLRNILITMLTTNALSRQNILDLTQQNGHMVG